MVRVGFLEEVAGEPKLGEGLETAPIKPVKALAKVKGSISQTAGPQSHMNGS